MVAARRLQGPQLLRIIWEVAKAAKLWDNDTVDVPIGLEFRSDHLLPADAPTIIFNEDIRMYPFHDINILLTFFTVVEITWRKVKPAKCRLNRLWIPIPALGSEIAYLGVPSLP